MFKKIIGIFICILLLIPILSSTVIASQEPILEIEIRGRSTFLQGAILIIEITNAGDVDAYNVTCIDRTKHPIFKILDISFNNTFDVIKAGETIKITSLLSWIGRIEIIVTVNFLGGEPITKTVYGFSIFSFILIFPN